MCTVDFFWYDFGVSVTAEDSLWRYLLSSGEGWGVDPFISRSYEWRWKSWAEALAPLTWALSGGRLQRQHLQAQKISRGYALLGCCEIAL